MSELKANEPLDFPNIDAQVHSVEDFLHNNEQIDSLLELLVEAMKVEYALVLKNKKVEFEYIQNSEAKEIKFLGMQREQILQQSVKSIMQADIGEEYILCIFNLDKNQDWSDEQSKLFRDFAKQLEIIIAQEDIIKDFGEKISILTEQNKKLKELDDLKTKLINTVSHELRTPLVSIMGFSNMLKRHEPTPELIQESGDQILQAGQRLSRMVDDFILLNRAESRGWDINLEPVDIVDMIRFAIDEFAPLNKIHRFVFQCEQDSPLVMADGRLLRQVIDNLIANAIKYSPRGGRIELSTKVREDMLDFSVKDEGIGIPEEEVDKVFERFYRVKSRETEAVGGMGLGLSICKDIITSLNGEISSTSHHGQGSTFSIKLPIYKQ